MGRDIKLNMGVYTQEKKKKFTKTKEHFGQDGSTVDLHIGILVFHFSLAILPASGKRTIVVEDYNSVVVLYGIVCIPFHSLLARNLRKRS